MVVVIVLAILAATIVPQFVGVTYDARVSTAKTNMTHLVNALERFNLKYDRYPTTEEGLQALVDGPKGAKNFRPLLREMMDDPWGNPFQYRSPGAKGGKTFDLWCMGSDGQTGGEGEAADIKPGKEKKAEDPQP